MKEAKQEDKKGVSSDNEPSALSLSGDGSKVKEKNITSSDEEPAAFTGEEPILKKPSKKDVKKGASSDEEPSTPTGNEGKGKGKETK